MAGIRTAILKTLAHPGRRANRRFALNCEEPAMLTAFHRKAPGAVDCCVSYSFGRQESPGLCIGRCPEILLPR
jgi:hypothetical protein